MTRLALLLVSVVALAAPALGAAQETTKEAQEAEPDSPARAGLERRQTLPPPAPVPSIFSVNGALRGGVQRSEEHTSELQSLAYLVCRLLLEKKKKTN